MDSESQNRDLLATLGYERIAQDRNEFGGGWTHIKLEALQQYLASYAKVMKYQRFTRIYVDAFAGTGRCDIEIDGEKQTIDGSARRALATDPQFDKYYFIELDKKKQAALHSLKDEYPDSTIEVIHNDANDEIKALCEKYSWQNERAVLFLDPFGMELDWETLIAVSRTKAVDLWYLFPYSGLYRQAAKEARAIDPGKEAALTRVLGTDEWKSAFYAPKPQIDLFDPSSDERFVGPAEMLRFVSDRLKKLFPFVPEPKILFQSGNPRSPKGAPLFALYFAMSNPSPNAVGAATRIANHILKS